MGDRYDVDEIKKEILGILLMPKENSKYVSYQLHFATEGPG